jgi:hypothetical protein
MGNDARRALLRLNEEGTYFFIGGLSEVLIELTDGVEGIGGLEADEAIDLLAEIFAGGGCSDRDGDDEAPDKGAKGAGGGFHGGSGGQAIVDENHIAAMEPGGWTAFAIKDVASRNLVQFASGNSIDDLRRDVAGIDHLVLDYNQTSAGNGAHGQFFVAGDTEFAHHKHIEGKVKRDGHLKGHGSTAAGQAENDGFVGVLVFTKAVAEGLDQQTASMPAVMEDDEQDCAF